MQNYILSIILLVPALIMTIRMIKLIIRTRKIKEYNVVVSESFNDQEKHFESISNYLNTNKDEEFNQKAMICLMAGKIRLKQTFEYFDKIKIDYLLTTNNKLDKQKSFLNSDSYFWLLMAIVNGRNDNDILDKLNFIINDSDYFSLFLYSDMAKSMIENFKGGSDFSFYHRFLEGDYDSYLYDKHLIGLFKKIATTILIYFNQEVSDEEMPSFSKTNTGNYILKELGLYEKYHQN